MSVPVGLDPPGGRSSHRTGRSLKGPLPAWSNTVVLAWLGVAVTLLVVHEPLGLPGWLALHAFLLGAVTTAIIVWSEHFVVALCRVPAPAERRVARVLAVLSLSVLLVLVGVATDLHWLSGTGATGVSVLAVVHAWHLLRIRRHALAARYAYLTAYYAAAAVALAVAGVLGGALTAGGMGWYERMWAAHVHVALLGWLGFSVLGTLFTLWPTAVRTRMPENSLPLARRSLPVLGAALACTAIGFAVANTWVAAVGLFAYATVAAVLFVPFARALLGTRPRRPAPWMLASAMFWFVAAILAEVGWLVSGAPVSTAVEWILPVIVVGFGAQILAGALTQLLPAVLGRGPAEHKRVAEVLDRVWLARLAAANLAVPLMVLGQPEPLPLLGWGLAVVSFGAFVLLALSVAVPVAVRGALPEKRAGTGVLPGLALGLAMTLVAAVFAVSGGGGDDPVAADGPAHTVEVELANMKITPSVVSVPEGSRLLLRVTNTDPMPHDLRLATGAHTARLGAGDTEVLDAGVVRDEVVGWCTIAGHRAAGMTMTIRPGGHEAGHGAQDDAAAGVAEPREAVLPPAAAEDVHRVELRVSERDIEIAPGQRERRWTFGGTIPGPVLRGKVGDRFEIILFNDGTLGHSIDFHAGALAPDEPMRTIGPGERLRYTFTATRAGAWLYHCSTPPMSQHLANGMYGAVIIDPPDLAPVAREYLLVGGELYAGAPGSDAQVDRIRAGEPDGWHFNGAVAQYDHAPLAARVGERVRFWVINGGPGGLLSFHVVGGQFDTVYKEGAWSLRPPGDGGAQALDLAAAQGGFVELEFPEPGTYPFVDHDMRHAEGGAHGVVRVTP